MPMSAASARDVAADQLGGWRFALRGELRALPRLLRNDERVVSVATGTVGNWKGRLFVATDSRLLMVCKPTLRQPRCIELPYDQVRVRDATRKGTTLDVRVVAGGELQSWHLIPAERGEQFLRALAEQGEAGASTIQPGAEGARPTISGAGVALLPNLAALAVVLLYLVGTVPLEPALIGFVGLGLVSAVVEWRRGARPLQIVLTVLTAVAVALFVFGVVPFGLGLLLAFGALAAEFSVRRRDAAAQA